MNKEEAEELTEKYEEFLDNGYFPENEEEIAEVNELARLFYRAHGYQVPEGHEFEESSHPQEQLMFGLATMAFNYVRKAR